MPNDIQNKRAFVGDGICGIFEKVDKIRIQALLVFRAVCIDYVVVAGNTTMNRRDSVLDIVAFYARVNAAFFCSNNRTKLRFFFTLRLLSPPGKAEGFNPPALWLAD